MRASRHLRDALGDAHEDQPGGDSGRQAHRRLPQRLAAQRHQCEQDGGGQEPDAQQRGAWPQPAPGHGQAAQEVARVVRGRDPGARPGAPVQGRDHQREHRGVEEAAQPHGHRQPQGPAQDDGGGSCRGLPRAGARPRVRRAHVEQAIPVAAVGRRRRSGAADATGPRPDARRRDGGLCPVRSLSGADPDPGHRATAWPPARNPAAGRADLRAPA